MCYLPPSFRFSTYHGGCTMDELWVKIEADGVMGGEGVSFPYDYVPAFMMALSRIGWAGKDICLDRGILREDIEKEERKARQFADALTEKQDEIDRLTDEIERLDKLNSG